MLWYIDVLVHFQHDVFVATYSIHNKLFLNLNFTRFMEM